MLRCHYLYDNMPAAVARRASGNRVTFSALHHFALAGYETSTYSIKYVLQGTEHYNLGGKRYAVSAGQYLLVNGHQAVDAEIRSARKVAGFCFHLEEKLLQEAAGLLHRNETQLLDDPYQAPPVPPLENLVYRQHENSLGQYLQQLIGSFHLANTIISAEPDGVYQQLSAYLAALQNDRPRTASSLGLVRHSTRQELLRRLQTARELLETQDLEGFTIDGLAKQCALSGSHLYRSFKKMYGVSPYQYLLQQKVAKAARLLKTEACSITEAALLCGFTDLASFSKTFKKQHGVAPSAFLRQ